MVLFYTLYTPINLLKIKILADHNKNLDNKSNNKYELNLINNHDQNQVYENAFNIVQYGWKKEAVPIIHQKKSLIGRFFDLFFN